MIRQFSGLYKSKVQNNWLQVLLGEGLRLHHKCLVPSVFLWSTSAMLAPPWGSVSPHGDQVATFISSQE